MRSWTRPLLMLLAVVAHGGLWGLGFLETERFDVPPAAAGVITFLSVLSRVGALALGLAELGRTWQESSAAERRLVGWLFSGGLLGAGITTVPMLVAAVEGRSVVEVLPAAWARWVWLGAAESALLAVLAGLFVGGKDLPVAPPSPPAAPPRSWSCECGRSFGSQQAYAAHARHCKGAS